MIARKPYSEPSGAQAIATHPRRPELREVGRDVEP